MLRLPIDEASAKIRTGPPVDDDEDYALPFWAGVAADPRLRCLAARSRCRVSPPGSPCPRTCGVPPPGERARRTRLWREPACPAPEHGPVHRVPRVHRRAAAAAAARLAAGRARALPRPAAVPGARPARRSPDLERAHPRHARPHPTCVAGDITAPRLGLAGPRRVRLSARADRRLSPGRRLRPRGAPRARAEGERRGDPQRRCDFLAGCAARSQRLHYVSTAYVSGTRHRRLPRDRPRRRPVASRTTTRRRSSWPRWRWRASGAAGDDLPARRSWWGTRGRARRAKFDGPVFHAGRDGAGAVARPVPEGGLGDGTRRTSCPSISSMEAHRAPLASTSGSAGRTYNLTDPQPLSRSSAVAAVRARAGEVASPTCPCRGPWRAPLFAPRGRAAATSGCPSQTLDYFDHPCRYDTTQATADLAAPRRALPAACRPTSAAWSRSTARHRDGVRRAAMV